MKVDLLRPARLFVFHFLLPSPALLRKHSLSYLRNPQISLDAENDLCVQVDQRFGLLLPHLFCVLGPVIV